MVNQIKIEAAVNIPNDLLVVNKAEFIRLQEQLLELQNQIQKKELPNHQGITEELMEVTEVAKRLKCNRNKVYDLIKSGALQGLKLGRIKVSTIELHDFLVRNIGKDLSDPYNIKLLVERKE